MSSLPGHSGLLGSHNHLKKDLHWSIIPGTPKNPTNLLGERNMFPKKRWSPRVHFFTHGHWMGFSEHEAKEQRRLQPRRGSRVFSAEAWDGGTFLLAS